MNHLTPKKPGCSTARPAAATYGSAALPVKGVCAVTDFPLRGVSAYSTEEHQFEASFAADRAAISRVRHQLRARLEEAGLESIADDVVLICTELATNAVLHGCLGFPPGTILQVSVVWSDIQLRLSVSDPSCVRPTVHELSASRASGRGLPLVEELSDRWGVEIDPSGVGKIVWTELDSPRRRAPCT